MKNSENLTIASLSICAAVLIGIVVGAFVATPTSVLADSSVMAGDYAMAAGEYRSDVDVIYVIDIETQRLNAYVANKRNNTIELRSSVDLTRAFR